MRNIFFIVGTGRSGTNLCQKMLRLHPGIKAVTETHFLSTLAHKFGAHKIRFEEFFEVMDEHYTSDGSRKWSLMHLRERGLDPRTFRVDFEAHCQPLTEGTAREFTEKFFDFCYGEGNYLLGDKTPTYGLEMKVLLEIFPRAKFIHLVRDGRFAAMSMQKHGGFERLINAGFPDKVKEYSYRNAQKDFSAQPVSLEQCIDFWARVAMLIREESGRIPPETYLEVRYEDLVLHPLRTMIRIAKFIHAPLDPLWLLRAAFKPKKSSLHGRKKLDPALVHALTVRVKPALEAFGYPTDES